MNLTVSGISTYDKSLSLNASLPMNFNPLFSFISAMPLSMNAFLFIVVMKLGNITFLLVPV